MGVDLGSKTIGLALSDLSLTVATPLETIRRVKFTADANRMLELIAQHGVGGLVVGLPLNMDGSEGPSAQSARAFVRNFEKLSPLPLAFWDERLSTAAVTRTLLEADTSRARRAEVVDKMAAAYILQGALERMRSL
ncbi:Holliday junction resolvase RuvX [Parvibaculum sedimenti]|nr:Holliday junction resolvase RuvX [Parvibaculum sedimenti]